MEQVGPAHDNLIGEMTKAMWNDLLTPDVTAVPVVVCTTGGIRRLVS